MDDQPEQAAYASEYTGYVPSRKSATATDRIQKLYESTPQFKWPWISWTLRPRPPHESGIRPGQQ